MSTQTSRGDVLDAVISPDGRYLAYLAGAAGRASLRVRQVATGSDVEVLPARDATLEMPGLLPGRQLPLLPHPQARQPQLPGALPDPVARGRAPGASVRRGLAGQLLARRQAGRLLAGRAPEAGGPAPRLRPRGRSRARRHHGGGAGGLPGRGRLVSRRRDDRRPAPEAGARPRDHGRLLRRAVRRAAGLPQAAADDPHEPGLAAGRPRPGRERAGAAHRRQRPGVPDQPSRGAAPEGHQRLQPLPGRLGLGGRGGHRRAAPDAPREPLDRRRRRWAGPADHLDHEPGGLPLRARGRPGRGASSSGSRATSTCRSGRSTAGAARPGRSPPESAHSVGPVAAGTSSSSIGWTRAASTSGACRRTGATSGS